MTGLLFLLGKTGHVIATVVNSLVVGYQQLPADKSVGIIDRLTWLRTQGMKSEQQSGLFDLFDRCG
jgi:hypothetical protein